VEAIGINVPGLITQFINFGLFLIVLIVILYRPVLRMLDQRSERIRESLEAAERARQESARSEQQVQQALTEARERAQQIVAQAQEVGQRMESDAREQARREAEGIVERARVEIQRERDEAIEQVRREFADLAIVAAERVISRSLDSNAHKALVEEVLQQANTGQGRGN
jgi:F-type H+-transporting ATPase subunit b